MWQHRQLQLLLGGAAARPEKKEMRTLSFCAARQTTGHRSEREQKPAHDWCELPSVVARNGAPSGVCCNPDEVAGRLKS